MQGSEDGRVEAVHVVGGRVEAVHVVDVVVPVEKLATSSDESNETHIAFGLTLYFFTISSRKLVFRSSLQPRGLVT